MRKPFTRNMTDHYSKISNQFDYLKDYGLIFTYSKLNGKLGDRTIEKFTYESPNTRKKLEIVYCSGNLFSRLYGFLIQTSEENQLDPQNFLPFDRLRCFFKERSDIILFGNAQYDFDYQLKEYKLVIDKFLNCLTSNKWINYSDLLKHEKNIYVLNLEPKQYFVWLEEIKSNDFVKNTLIITFDSSLEPLYEAPGLKLKSQNNFEFYITFGYKSRDLVGYSIQITYPDKRIEKHELNEVSTYKLIQFIKQMVCT